MTDDDVVECEHPGCEAEVLEEVAGRDPVGTLWIYWVCPEHMDWAEDQIDQKRRTP